MEQAEKLLLEEVKRYHTNSSHVLYSLPPTDEETVGILEHASGSDYVILCSYNAHLDGAQSAFIQKLGESKKVTVLLMLRNPYDRFISPDIQTALALYAPMPPTIEAGIARLFKG